MQSVERDELSQSIQELCQIKENIRLEAYSLKGVMCINRSKKSQLSTYQGEKKITLRIRENDGSAASKVNIF